MPSPPEFVAEYIEALVRARTACSRSEDRIAYTKHLAAAAEMSAAAQNGHIERLLAVLAAEERNFGWSYLSGEPGATAERAFRHLAAGIRSQAGV